MKITALNGQSIFDVALQRCGSIETAFAIARLNGLALTHIFTVTTVITVPDTVNADVVNYYSNNSIKPATQLNIVSDTGSSAPVVITLVGKKQSKVLYKQRTVAVMAGQSLFDIALQECGAIEAAFAIAKLNNLALTHIFSTTTQITVPDTISKAVVNYYFNNNIKPETQLQTGDTEEKYLYVAPSVIWLMQSNNYQSDVQVASNIIWHIN